MKCLTHYGLFIWVLGYFGLFLCNSCAGSKPINQKYIRLTLHLGCLRLQRHHVDKRAPPRIGLHTSRRATSPSGHGHTLAPENLTDHPRGEANP